MSMIRSFPRANIDGSGTDSPFLGFERQKNKGGPAVLGKMAKRDRDSSGEDVAIEETACCKAGRTAAKYDFREFLDETLAEQWAAMDGPGLRSIADRFNKKVIQVTLIEQGEPPIEGEEDLLYDQLTADSNERSERVERRLEKNGIDPTRLREDFISYKTIDRHFKNCTEQERETADPIDRSDAIDRVRKMNRRVEKVAANTLSELNKHTSLGFEDPDVSASVTVACPRCGERKSFTAAIKHGCECEPSTDRTGKDAESAGVSTSIQVDES